MNIKQKIQESGLKQWEIAEGLKINEFSLSRMLRRPEKLDKEIIDNINSVIERLLNEKKEGGE